MQNLYGAHEERIVNPRTGPFTHLARVNLLGNDDFILKVPNSSANLDIKLGNEIKIGWNSADARALDPK